MTKLGAHPVADLEAAAGAAPPGEHLLEEPPVVLRATVGLEASQLRLPLPLVRVLLALAQGEGDRVPLAAMPNENEKGIYLQVVNEGKYQSTVLRGH